MLVPVIGRRQPEQDWYQVTVTRDADPGVLRPVLAKGRMFDPEADDEVVMPLETARLNGLDVGSTFNYALYTQDEWRQILDENRYPPPTGPHPTLRVVGLVRDVRDGDRQHRLISAGPAFAERYDVGRSRWLSARLRGGVDEVDAFVEDVRNLLSAHSGRQQGPSCSSSAPVPTS